MRVRSQAPKADNTAPEKRAREKGGAREGGQEKENELNRENKRAGLLPATIVMLFAIDQSCASLRAAISVRESFHDQDV